MSHLAHWSDYSMPSPHGLDFHGLLDCLLDGLRELGVVVRSEQVVFACMPSLGRRGGTTPPDDLLLDRAGAAEHHDALVNAGCRVVEIRGAGWLPGRRYLVLLDHAWNGASDSTFPVVWAEVRGTVWPLSVAWFERLERPRALRPMMHWLAGHWWRQSCDMPVRPAWNTGPPLREQGCPTVS